MWKRIATACVLLSALGVPVIAYGAPSIEASPVVSVAGSVVEATSTLTTATIDALATAIGREIVEQSPAVQTVSLSESPESVYFRQVEHAAGLVGVFLLAVLVAVRVVTS